MSCPGAIESHQKCQWRSYAIRFPFQENGFSRNMKERMEGEGLESKGLVGRTLHWEKEHLAPAMAAEMGKKTQKQAGLRHRVDNIGKHRWWELRCLEGRRALRHVRIWQVVQGEACSHLWWGLGARAASETAIRSSGCLRFQFLYFISPWPWASDYLQVSYSSLVKWG